MNLPSVFWKSAAVVVALFGLGLVGYKLMGGADKWFDYEGFGVLGWAGIAFMIVAGLIFYLIHKKG